MGLFLYEKFSILVKLEEYHMRQTTGTTAQITLIGSLCINCRWPRMFLLFSSDEEHSMQLTTLSF